MKIRFESYVIKQIRKLYNINLIVKDYEMLGDSNIVFNFSTSFVPKEIVAISPCTIKSNCSYLFNLDSHEEELFDMDYISEDDMIILKYIQGRYYLDNYLDNLFKNAYVKLRNAKFGNPKE